MGRCAERLGKLERMRALEGAGGHEEIAAARAEMARWYHAATEADLLTSLETLQLAPGVDEGFRLLRERGVEVAIVSITWEFAVAWIARRLGVTHFVGTRLERDGTIEHFWPEDKPRWVAKLADRLGIGLDLVAAVGDSASDLPMLRIVGQAFFVGSSGPGLMNGIDHLPGGDIREIARRILIT